MINKDDIITKILQAMDDLKKSGLLEEIEDQANADGQRANEERSGDNHKAGKSEP